MPHARVTEMLVQFLILLVLSVPLFSQESDPQVVALEKAYSSMLPSIVQVRVQANCDGQKEHTLGTGFFVSSEGLVATARHVLLPDCELDFDQSAVLLASGRVGKFSTGFTEVAFRVVQQDSTKDIALLKLDRNPFVGEVHTKIFGREDGVLREVPVRHGVVPLDHAPQRVGLPVGITGYALNDVVEVTRSGTLVTEPRFEPRPGKPVPYVSSGGSSTVFILANLNVGQGDSGAPVYSLESGKVIGVCIGHLLEPVVGPKKGVGFRPIAVGGAPIFSNAGIAVIVPIEYVVSLLREATKHPDVSEE